MNKQFIEMANKYIKIFNITSKVYKTNDEIPVCIFLSTWQILFIKYQHW